MLLHYTGFTVIPSGRQYSFCVRNPKVPARFFTVSISNVSFRPGLLKYQEGPMICYARLEERLAAEDASSPLSPEQRVTESEVAAYTAAGAAKVKTWTDEQRLKAKLRAKADRSAQLMR